MAENKDKKVLNVPNLRFPEFEGEWEKCKVGDFGKIITGNTPPTKDIENYENGQYLWVSPADLGLLKSITETKTKLSKKGFDKNESATSRKRSCYLYWIHNRKDGNDYKRNID